MQGEIREGASIEIPETGPLPLASDPEPPAAPAKAASGAADAPAPHAKPVKPEKPSNVWARLHTKEPHGKQEKSGPPRRSVLAGLLAAVCGAAAGLFPFASGGYVLVSPLRRSKTGSGPAFLEVTRLDALPADGKARLFRIVADRQDAWTRHAAVGVGSVYLRRTAEKPNEVIALHSTCPHLGCFVDHKPDDSFYCPCHSSAFKPDGSRTGESNVSPRDMDHLQTRIEGDKVLVQFVNFATGVEHQTPLL